MNLFKFSLRLLYLDIILWVNKIRKIWRS